MSTDTQAQFTDRLFAGLQWLLPTRLLSRCMHSLAGCRIRWFKAVLIRLFMRAYRIDLSEAQIGQPGEYDSLNALFTRALRDDARPLPASPRALVCPVDGTLGQFGSITMGTLVQAKGQVYRVADLLGGRDDLTAAFLGGQFATFYLAPHNYHRVHMPLAGTLRDSHYIPGRLFGVNPASVRAIPRLFTRNERLATLFDTPAGPMGMILVGAFCVGSIETVWPDPQTHPRNRQPAYSRFAASGPRSITLPIGAEMGRFNLGSTVIMLLGPGSVAWQPDLAVGLRLKMGQGLAQT